MVKLVEYTLLIEYQITVLLAYGKKRLAKNGVNLAGYRFRKFKYNKYLEQLSRKPVHDNASTYWK